MAFVFLLISGYNSFALQFVAKHLIALTHTLLYLPSPAGNHTNDVLKMPSLSTRNGNGYWLDASTGGMVWRTSPSGDTLDMQKDHIADYAPVCGASSGAGIAPGGANGGNIDDIHGHASERNHQR